MTEHARDFVDPEDVRMPFGRYLGARIGDLPDLYLRWLRDRELPDPVRRAVDAECARRRLIDAARPVGPRPTRELMDAIVGAGHRALATQHHPDKGGNPEAMVALNNAVDWLRQLLRRA